VVLAPLSGYTDLPFRRACRAQGCFYAFTPLISAQSLVHSRERTALLLARGEEEPWLGVQLEGADPDVLARAAVLVRQSTVDCLDLNMGCPVPKVTRRGSGAALSRDPERAWRCLEAVRSHFTGPVTAKVRIVVEDDPEPTVSLVRGLWRAGAAAVTIHGRVQERVYAGPVAMDLLAAVRGSVPIPVVANGGVWDWQTAEALRAGTGCSRLMVARGAVGNPWIFREISERRRLVPAHEEVCDVVEDHVLGMLRLYGEERGMRAARKIVLAYLKGRGYRRELRDSVRTLATAGAFAEYMGELRAEGRSALFREEETRRGRGETELDP
jgi:tRNA-dihydrouridine synthase B